MDILGENLENLLLTDYFVCWKTFKMNSTGVGTRLYYASTVTLSNTGEM